jgi:hypothetical protein
MTAAAIRGREDPNDDRWEDEEDDEDRSRGTADRARTVDEAVN